MLVLSQGCKWVPNGGALPTWLTFTAMTVRNALFTILKLAVILEVEVPR